MTTHQRRIGYAAHVRKSMMGLGFKVTLLQRTKGPTPERNSPGIVELLAILRSIRVLTAEWGHLNMLMRRSIGLLSLVLLGSLLSTTPTAQNFFDGANRLPATDPGAFTPNISAYAADRIAEAKRLAESAVDPDAPEAGPRAYLLAWEAIAPLIDLPNAGGTLVESGQAGRSLPVLEAVYQFLRSLPEDGLASWQAHIRGRSLVETEVAAESGDSHQLLKVAMRYPMSDGGRRAARLAGDLAWESGDFATAAVAYQRLIEYSRDTTGLGPSVARLAEASSRLGWGGTLQGVSAREDLRKLPIIRGTDRLTVADVLASAKLEASDELLLHAATEDIAMVPVGRSGRALPTTPQDISREEWVSNLPVPVLESYYDAFMGLYPPEAPAPFPVVHQSNILVNTGPELVAFDLYTGRQLWSLTGNSALPDAYRLAETDPNLVLTVSAWQRMAFAALENPLSESIDSPRPQTYGLRPFMPMVRRSLVGADVVTGRMLWKLGGQYAPQHGPQDRTDTASLAKSVSFHHSIVWGDTLYAIGTERQNQAEVFLFAIEPETGEPLWHLSLCQGQVENTMFGSAAREPLPGIPVIAGGVLYLSSNLGGVVAVDLATRSLLWVSRYDSLPRPFTRERSTYYRKRTFLNSHPVATMLPDGKLGLLVAPTDSRHVTCFEARTGIKLWEYTVEPAQANVLEINDTGPSVLIGTDSKFVYIGHRSLLIQLSLADGKLQRQFEVTVRLGNSGGQIAISGRPAITDGAILWPGEVLSPPDRESERFHIARIKLTGEVLVPSVVESVPVPRRPGNLSVRSGVLLALSGDCPKRTDSFRRYSPNGQPMTLSAHFDLKALVESVRAKLARSPNDADTLVMFAQVASQLVRRGMISQAEVEELLRRALEVSRNDPKARQVADTARRGLFDQAMDRASTALTAGSISALESALDDAEQYTVTEGQRRDIFILREAGYAGSNEKLIELYTDLMNRGESYLLSLGDVRLPAYLVAQVRRGDRLARSSRWQAAIADWQAVSLYPLVFESYPAVYRDLQKRIGRAVADNGPSVYQDLEREAAAALAQANTAQPLRPIELEAIVRRWPHSDAALSAASAAIRVAVEMGLVNTLPDSIGAPLELRGNDPKTAQVVAELIVAYRDAELEIAMFVIGGRAAALPASTPVEFDGRETTIGALSESINQRFTRSSDPVRFDFEFPLNPKPVYSAQFQEEARVMVPEQVPGLKDLVFTAGMGQQRNLVAHDLATGVELWTGPELASMPAIFKVGERLVVCDAYAIRSLNIHDGEVRWTHTIGGARIWSAFVGGLGVHMMYEQGNNNQVEYYLVGVDCQQGREIWRTQIDPTSQNNLLLSGRSVYAASNVGSQRSLIRVDIVTGEIKARVELSRSPAGQSPIIDLSSAGIGLLMPTGEIEVRHPETLALVRQIASSIGSLRLAVADGTRVVGVNHMCGAFVIDAADGTTVWSTPNLMRVNTNHAEVVKDRLVIQAMDTAVQDKMTHILLVLDLKDGKEVGRHTLLPVSESVDGDRRNWNPHYERAVTANGLGILFTGTSTKIVDGQPITTPSIPQIINFDVARNTVSRIEVWDPAGKAMWPITLRSHPAGLVYCLNDRMAFYGSANR